MNLFHLLSEPLPPVWCILNCSQKHFCLLFYLTEQQKMPSKHFVLWRRYLLFQLKRNQHSTITRSDLIQKIKKITCEMKMMFATYNFCFAICRCLLDIFVFSFSYKCLLDIDCSFTSNLKTFNLKRGIK